MPLVSPNKNSRIGLTIRYDRMAASIVFKSSGDESPLVATEVLEVLQTAGVLVDDDVRQQTDIFVLLVASDEAPESFTVAKGRPVEGHDEIFVWNPDLEKEAVDWLSDAPVNFYTLNNIITVEKNTQIGTITPMVPPKDGRDVLGDFVPASYTPVALKLDDTVRRTDDEPYKVFANVAGKIVENGLNLSIDEALVIRGDIGFDTGNIDSTVAVHIGGVIPDRFEVKSQCEVTVAMSIESALVSAGGDVTVSRGIVGRGAGLVTSGGSIISKYCNDALLLADGDVKISKQSLNSHMCIAGNLIAGSANFVGGSVYAKDQVELASIGSQRNIPTRIYIGVHAHTVRDLASIELRIIRVEKLTKQIRTALTLLSNTKSQLSAEQHTRIKTLKVRVAKMIKMLAAEKNHKEELLEKIYSDEPASVLVSRTIFSGTMIRITDRQTTFYRDMKGPVRIEKQMIENVTEIVAVNTASNSVKVLSSDKRTPAELIEGFEESLATRRS